MSTLSNVTTRRGEANPLSVGLTPDSIPEAKSSQTGVSVRCAYGARKNIGDKQKKVQRQRLQNLLFVYIGLSNANKNKQQKSH